MSYKKVNIIFVNVLDVVYCTLEGNPCLFDQGLDLPWFRTQGSAAATSHNYKPKKDHTTDTDKGVIYN